MGTGGLAPGLGSGPGTSLPPRRGGKGRQTYSGSTCRLATRVCASLGTVPLPLVPAVPRPLTHVQVTPEMHRTQTPG